MGAARHCVATSSFIVKFLPICKSILSSLIPLMTIGCHIVEKCLKELRRMLLEQLRFNYSTVHLSSMNRISSSTPIVISYAFLHIHFRKMKRHQTRTNHCFPSM